MAICYSSLHSTELKKCPAASYDYPSPQARLDDEILEHFCSKDNLGVTTTELIGHSCSTMGSMVGCGPTQLNTYLQQGLKLVHSVKTRYTIQRRNLCGVHGLCEQRPGNPQGIYAHDRSNQEHMVKPGGG